jgi:hypothetical protein
MSKKSRERRKAKDEAKPEAKVKSSGEATAALKRRRNKRWVLVGILAASFPIFELIAYQFRAITITFVNKLDQPIKDIKLTYDGGSMEIPELKPGVSESRRIRPDFSFRGNKFATYSQTISYKTQDGIMARQLGRAGALDFSAREFYTIEPQLNEKGLQIQIQHSTQPGFPMSLVRDLIESLGFR